MIITASQYCVKAATYAVLTPVVVVTEVASAVNYTAGALTRAYSEGFVKFELAVFDLAYKLETMKDN